MKCKVKIKNDEYNMADAMFDRIACIS